jgi:DNA-binding NarL/FixJ family response regulator
MTQDRINVLVTHEDPIVAAGLAAVLGEQFSLSVTHRPSDPDAAPVAPRDVEVIVTDYRSAMALAQAARRDGPRMMVVHRVGREWEVRSAINAGIHGFVLQSCHLDELVHGVRMLGRGSRYLCQAVAECMADSLTREALTSRETDVLQLLARGCCNKTISNRLGIAVGTVKAHVKAILEKLNAATRTQAAAIAADRGLVEEAPAPASVMPMVRLGAPATHHRSMHSRQQVALS